jgi:ribulose 1,5-bisphosphate synthetase/thiazole synthase
MLGTIAVVSILCTAAVDYDYDVIVYGSTPAGIAAATAAGQLGMSVALYEPLKMIGGMGAAGNLGLHDGGPSAPRTGLALNYTMLNAEYYKVDHPVNQPESFASNLCRTAYLYRREAKARCL